MNAYRIHYTDDFGTDHEVVTAYVSDRTLDPYREEDREEIAGFIRRNVGDKEAEAWLHYGPGMADNGLEKR